MAPLNNDSRMIQLSDSTKHNSHKERRDICLADDWQMNLVIVTIIGKEISLHLQNPI